MSRIIQPAEKAEEEEEEPKGKKRQKGKKGKKDAGAREDEDSDDGSLAPATKSDDLAPVTEPPPPTNQPIRLGVLKFSRDFIQPEQEVREGFSRALVAFDFQREVQSVFAEYFGDHVNRAEDVAGDPVTYSQIEAPVLTLDPNADPKLKEKRLLARVRQDADGLVFGHLHQSKTAGQVQMDIYLRVLTRDGQRLLTASLPWPRPPNRRQGAVRDRLRGILFNLANQVLPDITGLPVARGFAPDPGSTDYFTITIQP